MLDWLFLIFALYVFCVALSLSPYIFLEHFQRQGAEEKKKKKNKDKEKSRTEVDIEVS